MLVQFQYIFQVYSWIHLRHVMAPKYDRLAFDNVQVVFWGAGQFNLVAKEWGF